MEKYSMTENIFGQIHPGSTEQCQTLLVPFQAVLQAQMWETQVTWFFASHSSRLYFILRRYSITCLEATPKILLLLAFSVTFHFLTELKGTCYLSYDANAKWQIATPWLSSTRWRFMWLPVVSIKPNISYLGSKIIKMAWTVMSRPCNVQQLTMLRVSQRRLICPSYTGCMPLNSWAVLP